MPVRTARKLPPRLPKHEMLQPPGWPAPKGYANGIKARGEFVFVGGMVGWDAKEKFPKGFVAQAKQAMDELATSLESSLQKITDAIDNASGTAGAVAAATAIGNDLVDMGNQVSTASQKLQDIDAQGELADAFAQADSCAGLTGTS